jgi:hypothetical protein
MDDFIEKNELSNWQRLQQLWSWLGRGESDARLLHVLRRYAPKAPLKALERARLGDARGAGRMRPGSARAIVGPLLGVMYSGEDIWVQMHDYDGPAPLALRAHLRTLSTQQHIDLAEHWVDYLRQDRADMPAPWPMPAANSGTLAPPPDPAPVLEQLLALMQELRSLISAGVTRS